jgi:deoxycytidylate deaminase
LILTKKQNITAIIYDKKGRVLSIGKNSYTKTHPIMAKHAEELGEPYKQFLHAEIAAIIKCKQLDKAYRISVFREGAKGKYLNAKPCPICASAIQQTDIKVIEHT